METLIYCTVESSGEFAEGSVIIRLVVRTVTHVRVQNATTAELRRKYAKKREELLAGMTPFERTAFQDALPRE